MLSFNFSFGRLLQSTEKLTAAKFNAIVKGIVATLNGTVGTSDLNAGAVTAAKVTTDAYWYALGTLGGSTYSAAYTPAISSYTDGLVLAFKAGTANTSGANLDAGAGGKQITKHAGQALETGDILAGQIVEVRFNSSLVAGGCFEMLSLQGTPEASVAPLLGSARNLNATNSVGSPTSTITLTADEIVLKNSVGTPYLARNVNLTVNITASGANGLDTGGVSQFFYYLWVIYNPTTQTVAGLFSLSRTAPTMPAGYTYKALVSALWNNNVGSAGLRNFIQMDRSVAIDEQFVIPAGTAGSNGVWNIWTAGTIVPPNARKCRGNMGTSTNAAFAMAVCGMPSPAATVTPNVGLVRGQAGNAVLGAFGTFQNAVPFEVEVFLQAGNACIQVNMVDNVAKYCLSVSGYTI